MKTPKDVQDEVIRFLEAMPDNKVIAIGLLCEVYGVPAKYARGMLGMVRADPRARTRPDPGDPPLECRLHPESGEGVWGKEWVHEIDLLRAKGIPVSWYERTGEYRIDMRSHGMKRAEAKALRSRLEAEAQ